MKRLILCLLSVFMVLTAFLVGCGKEGNDVNDNGGNNNPPPHSHVLTKVERVEPTYENEGNILYYKCDGVNGCGKLFSNADATCEISLSSTILEKLEKKLEFLTKDIVYVYDDIPSLIDGGDEILFYDYFRANTTNALGNETYEYVYLKDNNKGDYVVEFEIYNSGVYNFGLEIKAMPSSSNAPRRRVTNVQIDNSECIMLDYTHEVADCVAQKLQYAYGFSAYLDEGVHTITLSLPSIFNDDNVKSLFLRKLLYVMA